MTRDSQPGSENAHRISIVGPTGSGKTYLARLIADKSGLPHHQLDMLRLDSAGRQLSSQEFTDAVAALAGQDHWIIDGHYRAVREEIWSRADTIIWLNYPLPLVLLRLVVRFGRKASHVSGGSGAGCEPKTGNASWSHRLGRFQRTLRERGEYNRLLRKPEYANARLIELKSTRATQEWLRQQSF